MCSFTAPPVCNDDNKNYLAKFIAITYCLVLVKSN